jgi:hypothetical protein
MRDLFRNIALRAGLTALLLGIVGVVLAEMAATSLTTPVSARPGTAQMTAESVRMGESTDEIRARIPLAMAIWGFVIMTVYEVLRHLLRRRKTAAPPPPSQPDESEKLLEELLAQAESKSAALSSKSDAPPVESAAPSAAR